jgi:ribosome-binding factor A
MDAGFEHLREAMAQVLVAEVEFPKGTLVTVLHAKMTANTAHAKFTLSVFPVEMEQEVRRTLKDYEGEIKDSLAERLRLRRIPDLHYEFDHTEAEAAVIENELLELRKKGEV